MKKNKAKRKGLLIVCVLSALSLAGCTEMELASHFAKKIPGAQSKSQGKYKVGSPYKIQGKWYTPKADYNYAETGIASWYGPNFHGKPTANGEIFDQNELTAAHKTLPLPSLVRVTNLDNGRSIVARVNDRGPFSRGRIIDMSKRSAELLGFKIQGTAKVRVEILKQESLAIAEAAKRGEDTRGIEVAMNENSPAVKTNNEYSSYKAAANKTRRALQNPAAPNVPISRASDVPQKLNPTDAAANAQNAGLPSVSYNSETSNAGAKLQPVETVMLKDAPVPGHSIQGDFYPDPVVDTVPIVPTNIYVQAGSFSNQANAVRLAQRLKTFGKTQVQPAMVNGQQFYRVRILSQSVDQADTILSSLVESGRNQAIIVVE